MDEKKVADMLPRERQERFEDPDEERGQLIEGRFSWKKTEREQIREDYAALDPWALKFHDMMELIGPWLMLGMLFAGVCAIIGGLIYYSAQLSHIFWTYLEAFL